MQTLACLPHSAQKPCPQNDQPLLAETLQSQKIQAYPTPQESIRTSSLGFVPLIVRQEAHCLKLAEPDSQLP